MGQTTAIVLALLSALGQPGRSIPASSQPAGESRLETAKERRVRPSALNAQQLADHYNLIKNNNTPEARKFGATRLLETATADAIAKLTELLAARPGDLAAQTAICEAIADSNAPSRDLIPALLALLGDKRSLLNDAVTNALLRFETRDVVQHLSPIASDASIDLDKRLAAISALGAMSDNLAAIEALMALLNDPSQTVQAFALNACRLGTNLDFADGDAALAWWKENQNVTDLDWLKMRNDQRAILLRKAANESTALTTRLVAAYRESFHKTSEAERPRRLLSLLQDAVPAVRLLGIDLVNDLITDRKDIPQETKLRLTELLTDPNSAVRLAATKIIGDLRLPGAFATMSRAVMQESDPTVRVAQVNAIGRLEDPAAIGLLFDSLHDDVPAVVGEAALSLARASRRPESAKLAPTDQIAAIPKALADRYSEIRQNQDDLRVQFLTAMATISDVRFRSVFRAEMNATQPIRTRRAAIAGLAAFGDNDAADAIRANLGDPEAEIRLAAAESMAKCGRRRGDLGALAERLNQTTEPDANVRQRAWASYLQIAAQLPPEEQIKVSDEFDRPTDKVAQRRRLEILKPLATDTRPAGAPGGKSAPAKFEQLSKSRKAEVLERMADAQWNLGEFATSSASFEQAMTLLDETAGSRFVQLATRCIAARLKAHEDAPALQRLRELLDQSKGDATVVSALTATVFNEIRQRTESAGEAAMFADAINLIESAKSTLAAGPVPVDEQVKTALRDVTDRRSAMVDKLLASLSTEDDAESRLLTFPRETVIARLHDRLKSTINIQNNDAQADERLMQLARKLAPNWVGFARDSSPEERAAALEKLLNAAATKAASSPGLTRPTADASSAKTAADAVAP